MTYMSKRTFDFTKDEELVTQVINALKAPSVNETTKAPAAEEEKKVEPLTVADILRHDERDAPLFQAVAAKLLNDCDKDGWEKFVEFSATSTEILDEQRPYLLKTLFFNAAEAHDNDMTVVALTAAVACGLNREQLQHAFASATSVRSKAGPNPGAAQRVAQITKALPTNS